MEVVSMVHPRTISVSLSVPSPFSLQMHVGLLRGKARVRAKGTSAYPGGTKIAQFHCAA